MGLKAQDQATVLEAGVLTKEWVQKRSHDKVENK